MSHRSFVAIHRSLAVAAFAVSAGAAVAQDSTSSLRAGMSNIGIQPEFISTIVTQGGAGGPTAPGNPDNDQFLASNARGYSSVVSLLIRTPVGNFGCSGTLINSRQVLTAAHCVTNGDGSPAINANSVQVRFWNNSNVLANPIEVATAGVAVHPGYTGLVVADNDVAIITMPTDAPAYAGISSVYAGPASSVLNQTVTFVGFGTTGTGLTGDAQPGYAFARRFGYNRFESTCSATGTTPDDNDCVFDGSGPNANRTNWLADFDNGNANTNSLCLLYGSPVGSQNTICNPGVTSITGSILDEVGIGRGDSGGPALFNGMIVGIASWGTGGSLNDNFGSWGAFYGHTNVLTASNRAWISSQIVPEPGTYAMVVVGLLGTGAFARRRRQQA